jgi:hypothetical protein
MYQFSTTNIINSALDSNGTTAKFAGSATAFNVARVGTFLTDKIVSVYKQPYKASVLEVAKVTIPTITAGLVARVEIEVGLSQQTNSEYASTYLGFSKPVTVEVIAVGTAATDATALKNAINSMRDTYGISYVTATTDDDDLIVTATDPNQRIVSMKILKEAGSTDNSIIEPTFTDVSSTTFTVTTSGVSGFGTDAWMAQHITIPTAENVRYHGISKDERPIIGGNYSQYTLRYIIDKDGDDGIVSGLKSVTTHVFYVPASLVAAFEVALANAGISPNTVNVAVTALTVTSGNLDLSEYATSGYTLTYTTTPSGVTGAVWSRNTDADVDAASSDADFSKVTVSPSGVITLATGHGLAASDVIGLTVTIDGYTVNKTLTVQA